MYYKCLITIQLVKSFLLTRLQNTHLTWFLHCRNLTLCCEMSAKYYEVISSDWSWIFKISTLSINQFYVNFRNYQHKYLT